MLRLLFLLSGGQSVHVTLKRVKLTAWKTVADALSGVPAPTILTVMTLVTSAWLVPFATTTLVERFPQPVTRRFGLVSDRSEKLSFLLRATLPANPPEPSTGTVAFTAPLTLICAD